MNQPNALSNRVEYYGGALKRFRRNEESDSATSDLPPRQSFLLRVLGPSWCWYILGMAVLLLGFLVGPRIPDELQQDNCVGNVRLARPFGIHLNCDSPEFLSLATHPQGLLAKDNYRQSRPGLILVAALLAWPLSVLDRSTVTEALPSEAPQRIIDAYERYFPEYVSYMLLNVSILLLSFFLLRKIFEQASPNPIATPIVVSIGLLVISNDVSKAFFWSPHTQMFNILVPVMAVYATVRVWEGALVDRRFTVGLGLAVGLGLTAYGVFAIIPVCVILVSLVMLWRGPASRLRAVCNLVLMLVLSLAPTVIWYWIVRLETGYFHSAEVQEDAFVWMLWAWDTSPVVLITEWLRKCFWMIRYAAPQALSLFASVMFILWMAWRYPLNAKQAFQESFVAIGAGVFISLTVLIFYTCVGWIFWRLAFPIIPPLIVAVGAFGISFARTLHRKQQLLLCDGIVLIAVANLIYVVAKDGPFS